MAILQSMDPDLCLLLCALGMPDHCVKFVLVAEVDEPLKVRATYYPDVDHAVKVTKTYKLVGSDVDAAQGL